MAAIRVANPTLDAYLDQLFSLEGRKLDLSHDQYRILSLYTRYMPHQHSEELCLEIRNFHHVIMAQTKLYCTGEVVPYTKLIPFNMLHIMVYLSIKHRNIWLQEDLFSIILPIPGPPFKVIIDHRTMLEVLAWPQPRTLEILAKWWPPCVNLDLGDGTRPLGRALRSSFPGHEVTECEVIRILLEYGAKLENTENLRAAIMKNRTDILEALLKYLRRDGLGLDGNLQSNNAAEARTHSHTMFESPLHIAIRYNCCLSFRWLLRENVALGKENCCGLSASQLAAKVGRADMPKALRDYDEGLGMETPPGDAKRGPV